MAVATQDILTIDVEEWFHGHNYLEHVPPEQWDREPSRLEGGLRRCLDLLARHRIQATFFVLGWTAERHPDLIREIVAQGHEIGCHSYAHPVVYELSREEFRADCERALAALAAAGVTSVGGYRAPSFTMTPPVHGYLEVLQDLGFVYDCSIFPIRHPRYGQPESPRYPYRLGPGPSALTVVPMPTWRLLGQNLPFAGGGYLRWLPLPVFNFIRAGARRQGLPCVLYVHPWELDDFRPEVGQGKLLSLRSQGGRQTMPRKLEAILDSGSFETLGAYVERLGKAGNWR